MKEKNKDYTERRGSFLLNNSPKMELRDEADNDQRTIYGIASTVDHQYDMGWYDEEIVRGAFDDVLNDDVVFLFDHEGLPMARTTSEVQKLELTIDERGNLAYKLPIRSE